MKVIHTIIIALYLWLAAGCAFVGRWHLSLIWLLGLAAYVAVISINVKPKVN